MTLNQSHRTTEGSECVTATTNRVNKLGQNKQTNKHMMFVVFNITLKIRREYKMIVWKVILKGR